MGNNGIGKILARSAFGIILALVLLEVSSLAALLFFRELRPEAFSGPFVDGQFDAVTGEDLKSFIATSYDPELGWDNQPLSERQQINSIGESWRNS